MSSFGLFFQTVFFDPITFFFCALITTWLVSAIFLLFRSTVVSSGRSARFIAMTATSLATLGILGTFTGILIGLLNFNVDEIDKSVPDLLEGLKIAFATSIVGISAAIIFRGCRAFSPTQASTDGIGPEDIFRVLEEIRDNARTSSEQSSKQLLRLRAAISSDGDSSLLTQMQKLRSDAKDNHNALIKEFRDFATHMVENNQKAIIEALEQVIRDFNQNLTEQFGENFKQLNQAVEALVKWQENYRLHVEALERRLSNAVSATEASRQALEGVQTHAERIPQMIQPLEPVLRGISSQTKTMEAHLKTIADLRDKAVEAFPVIETNLRTITTDMKKSVDDVLTQSRKAVADSVELHDALSADQKNLIEKVEGAQNEFSAQLASALSEMNKQAKDGFDKHTEIIEKAAEKSKTAIDGAWADSVKKMNDQFTNFDSQMQQELSRSLQLLGSKMASVSEKLVKDYTPLTDKLRELVSISNRVN